jgi:hypothetical protein
MNGTVRTIVRRGNYVAAVITLVIVIITLLGGCTRTVTITAKYRAFYGWWYVCTGAQPFPCSKGHIWRVTQQEYDRARVGQAYKVTLP